MIADVGFANMNPWMVVSVVLFIGLLVMAGLLVRLFVLGDAKRLEKDGLLLVKVEERRAQLAELVELRNYKRDAEARKAERVAPVIDWDALNALSVECDGGDTMVCYRLEGMSDFDTSIFHTTPEQHLALCEEFKAVRQRRSVGKTKEVDHG